jgi:hypothetical protein
LPIEITTGFSRAASSSARVIVSAAATLPPGLSIRTTIALTVRSSVNFLICRSIVRLPASLLPTTGSSRLSPSPSVPSTCSTAITGPGPNASACAGRLPGARSATL